MVLPGPQDVDDAVQVGVRGLHVAEAVEVGAPVPVESLISLVHPRRIPEAGDGLRQVGRAVGLAQLEDEPLFLPGFDGPQAVEDGGDAVAIVGARRLEIVEAFVEEPARRGEGPVSVSAQEMVPVGRERIEGTVARSGSWRAGLPPYGGIG